MKLRFNYIVAVAAAMICTPSHAEDFATGHIMQLADVIARCSPELESALLEGQIQQSTIQSENMLADPNFEVEHVWGLHNIGNKLAIGVSQEFTMPAVYSKRRSVAMLAGHEAQLKSREVYVAKRLEAAQSLALLACMRHKCRICDSLKTIASENLTIAEHQLEKGNITRLDLYKAQLELNRLSRLHLSAEQQLSDAKASIATILAGNTLLDPDTLAISLPAILPALPSWNAIEQNYLDNSPTVALRALHNEMTHAQLSLVKAERWPALSLGYVYQREMGDTFHGLSFSMSLPFWSRKHQREVAELSSRKFIVDDRVAETSALMQMRNDYRRAQSLRAQIELIDKVLEHDGGTSVLNRMYEVGQINLTDYNNEMTGLLELKLERVDLLAEYLTSLASVSR